MTKNNDAKNFFLNVSCNSLPPKENSDKFMDRESGMVEKLRPENGISGLYDKTIGDSVQKSHNGCISPPIITNVPNSYKEIGTVMSDEGFVKLPRSLLKSEDWKSLRLRQQKLFLYILEKAQHCAYVFKFNGKNINLGPGDLCISIRRLVDDYNCSVKFKDEKIDIPFVQRAVSTFSKLGLTDTRTDTGITIIRIKYPGIYENQNNTTDTQTDTHSIHLRYTKEECKNDKNIKETIDGAIAIDSSPLNLENEEKPKVTEQEKNISVLWKYCVENGMAAGKTRCGKPGVKKQDVVNWLKNYPAKEIIECLKITKESSIQKTYGAYINKLLKDRIPQREKALEEGRKFVEELVKKHKMKHIDLKQDYFLDLISTDQTYYNLPKETLHAILKRSYERAREREYQERHMDQENE